MTAIIHSELPYHAPGTVLAIEEMPTEMTQCSSGK